MYKYLLYFLIFSFSGWCVEVGYHVIKLGKFENRGLAWGPFCPIYGVGICLSSLLLSRVDSFILTALLSMAIATAVELFVGFFTDRLLSLRLWDYSGEKGNILGYVCPRFSFAWGIACALVIKLLPLLDPLISWLYAPLFKGAAFMIFILILVDVRVSMLEAGMGRKSALSIKNAHNSLQK